MRRRVREAYRLHRDEYTVPSEQRLDALFLYVADECVGYARVEAAMMRLLAALQQYCHDDTTRCQ